MFVELQPKLNTKTIISKVPQPLAEVDLLIRAEREDSGALRDYAWQNEISAAAEAVGVPIIIPTRSEYAQGLGFMAFSQQTIKLYERGLSDYKDRANAKSFEIKRRQEELAEELHLNEATAVNIFTHFSQIAVSPFPEEAVTEIGESAVKALGYYPSKKKMQLRLHTVEAGQRVTYAVLIPNSQLRALRMLMGIYGVSLDDQATGADVIKASQSLYFFEPGIRPLLQFLEQYDQVLSFQNEDQAFFLGSEVDKKPESAAYEQIITRGLQFHQEAEPWISYLMEYNQALADSLQTQVISVTQEREISYLLKHQNTPKNVKGVLLSALYDKKMTRTLATYLKEQQRSRVWSILRAKVEGTKLGINTPDQLDATFFENEVDEALAALAYVFIICGGLGEYGDSMSSIQGKYINGEPVIGLLECVTCPFCTKEVNAPYSTSFLECPECHTIVNR